jgi:hypothetical protein
LNDLVEENNYYLIEFDLLSIYKDFDLNTSDFGDD